MKDEFGLTNKQRIFAERFVVDEDGPAALQEAGYADSMLQPLLTHPLVKNAIDELRKQRIERLKMSQDDALIHLKKMAEPTFSDFHEQDPDTGKFVVKKQIPPEKLAAVKEIRTGKSGDQTIVLYNRETLLDKVLRVHGSYITKHQITGQIEHKHEHAIDQDRLIEEMNRLLAAKRAIPVEAEVIEHASLPEERHE